MALGTYAGNAIQPFKRNMHKGDTDVDKSKAGMSETAREAFEYGHSEDCRWHETRRSCDCGFSAKCALKLMQPEYKAAVALYLNAGKPTDYAKHDVCIRGEYVETAKVVLKAALSTLPTMTEAELESLVQSLFEQAQWNSECGVSPSFVSAARDLLIARFPHLLTPEPLVKVRGES